MKLQRYNFKNAIVLTGGIDTGKSTVGLFFISHGFDIIDADKIAHKILDQNSNNIAILFGNQYVEDAKVLRKKLGTLIFNNFEEKKKLESFIHPLIEEEIIRQAKVFEAQNKVYFIDIPLFFEKRNYNIKKSIVVYTTKEIQTQRLMDRDKCNETIALSKINNQMNIEDKRKLATYIIDNTKDLKNLEYEVKRITKELV